MLKWLGTFILNIGVEKLIDLIINLLERVKAFQKIKEETKKSLEPLRKAETNEDIDKAVRDSFDKF